MGRPGHTRARPPTAAIPPRPCSTTSPPFRRRSVALALYRMLTGRRFDICTVRDALAVADLHPERARFESVRLHHGTPYVEMPPGFHAELANHTLGLFADRPFHGTGVLRDLAGMAGVDPTTAPALPAATA